MEVVLRDANLVPLSHQHQHALALCVRIDRGLRTANDIERWNKEIQQLFESEIQHHFAAEEQLLFPDAREYNELAPLVDQLLRDHSEIRSLAERTAGRRLGRSELLDFATLLSAHVRTEERQLFERCQELMPPDVLARLGADLNGFFRAHGVQPED